jgi:hypothetical protein
MQEAGRMQLRARSSNLWRVGSALSLGQVEFGMESESERNGGRLHLQQLEYAILGYEREHSPRAAELSADNRERLLFISVFGKSVSSARKVEIKTSRLALSPRQNSNRFVGVRLISVMRHDFFATITCVFLRSHV